MQKGAPTSKSDCDCHIEDSALHKRLFLLSCLLSRNLTHPEIDYHSLIDRRTKQQKMVQNITLYNHFSVVKKYKHHTD